MAVERDDRGAVASSPRAGRPAVSMAGFACCMAYLFMMSYASMDGAVSIGGFSSEHADFSLFLLGCALSLALVAHATPRARDAALSPAVVSASCALAAVCSLSTAPEGGADAFRAAFALFGGAAGGLLLAAWGRALQQGTAGSVTRKVMIACGLAALACLAGSLLPRPAAAAATSLLPVACAACLRPFALRREGRAPAPAPEEDGSAPAGDAPAGGDGARRGLALWDVLATKEQRASTRRLSGKMLAGAALFGAAAGFMQTFDAGQPAFPHAFAASALPLGLFAVACLQLVMDEVRTPGGEADAYRAEGRSLQGSYRLAVLLMMAGYLFVPVLAPFSVTGQSVVLAGFLGLQFVLASIFLIASKVGDHDASLVFSRGFACLYAGQAAGLVAGMALDAADLSGALPFAVAAFAGLATLFACLFLFTEEDFGALVRIAAEADRFDGAGALIAERYGLSKREAELLPFALRGRTGERIASELFIAKSTVETHLRRIYQKTGADNRQELIDLGERAQAELGERLSRDAGAKGPAGGRRGGSGR